MSSVAGRALAPRRVGLAQDGARRDGRPRARAARADGLQHALSARRRGGGREKGVWERGWVRAGRSSGSSKTVGGRGGRVRRRRVRVRLGCFRF